MLRDSLYSTDSTPSAWPAALAVSAIFACISFRLLSSWLSHLSAAQVSRTLRLALMEHLGKLPLHWFATRSTGELKKILNTDVGEIDKFIAHNITDTVSALCLPFVSILVMSWVDWRLALLLIVLMVYAASIQVGSYKDAFKNKFMQRYNEALVMLHVDSADFVQGMPDIKIFNKSTESFSRMGEAVRRLNSMQEHVVSFYALRWGNYLTVIAAPLAAMSIAGGIFHMQGTLPIDRYILAIMLGSLALVPLVAILRFSSFVMRTYYSCVAIMAILDVPIERKGNFTRNDVGNADIHVSGLTKNFGDKPVLKDVSFRTRPGTVTAVVGMSGSGKSTLATILAGMEEADSGSITIGGLPLGSLPSAELAACFSVVFQKPFIFSGTVIENIRLGKEDASVNQVIEAARMAHAAGFIETLPQGYDTMIGAGGDVHLSGGQYQRIALARMALRNAPIVLLDEATAFSDPESEAEIQKGLASYLTDKTVIVIAHRLRSIAAADTIIVLDQGQIVQTGNHEELLATEGIYARLWAADATARSWTIRNKSLCHDKEQV
nr:ABC transporter ATP-binding protein [Pseudodesulfovibrio alkaliphilus]